MDWLPSKAPPGGMARRALLALCLLAQVPPSCLGALTWASTRAALAAVSGDKEVVAVFKFRNAGPSPVTVTSLTTSCHCTTAEIAKNTFAPGEAGEVRVVFTLGPRSGPQEKTITVATDDRPSDPAVLTLDVDIREVVSCEPRLVVWRRGEADTEKPVEIAAGASESILAVSASPESPAVASRLETLEAGRRYRLWLKPASTAQPVVVGVACTVRVAGRPSPPLSVVAEVD